MYAGIGKKVVGQKHHNKEDTMVTAGWVVRIVKDALLDYTIDRVIIRIDDTGVGGGVTDRLNEIVIEEGLDWEIVPINKNG